MSVLCPACRQITATARSRGSCEVGTEAVLQQGGNNKRTVQRHHAQSGSQGMKVFFPSKCKYKLNSFVDIHWPTVCYVDLPKQEWRH